MDSGRLAISRLKYLIFFTILVFTIILVHLFKLQITLNNNFFILAKKNFLHFEKIPSARGNITDKYGNLLATSKPVYDIYWQGTGQKKLTNKQDIIINELQNILKFSPEIKENIIISEKQSRNFLLFQDLNFEQLSMITEKFGDFPNLIIKQEFKRYYPLNTVASHVVGYLSTINMEPIGSMGIEYLYEDNLKGQSGEIVKIKNSIGKKLEEQELKKSSCGETITTTLNLDLQKIAEELFPKDESGACIVLDPQTGAIETLLSRPTFDPNIFLKPISETDWKELQEKKPFVNRVYNACYPPASLFKLVTLAAALETGLITENTFWHCIGNIEFGGRIVRCHKHEGHGTVNTQQALMHSCNIPFYEIGKKIKVDTLAKYANKFGLGIKTSDLFQEKAGLVPTIAWKKRVKGEPWWTGETLSSTIGQGYYLVTPIQIACMISSICEGYRVKPRILGSDKITKIPLDISKKTIGFLKQCLKQVIKGGSGKRLNQIMHIEIYGKTGTAQTSDLSKRDLGKKYVEHGYFVAYFKYNNHKPLTIVLMLENVGSSQVATNLALKILLRYCALLDEKEAQSVKSE